MVGRKASSASFCIAGAVLLASLSASLAAQELGDKDEKEFKAHFSDYDLAPFPHDHPADAVDITALEPLLEPASGEIIEHLGVGHASFYGRRFAGRRTANGETFDPRQLTAAHRTLPFGSLVRVTNPRNGRSVTVRINDRGPFIKGREIDLSRAAAEQIGLVKRGVGKVELALVAP